MSDTAIPLDPSSPPQVEPGAPAPPPAASPAPAAPSPDVEALQARVAELDQRNRQWEQVVTNLVQSTTAATAGQPTAPTPVVVSPAARQYLRSRGMSDEDIDQTAGIIGPYLDYAQQVAIAPLQAENRQLRDQVEGVVAPNKYKDWDVVGADVEKIKQVAAQRGEFLSTEQAYEKAVVQNIDKVVAKRTMQAQAATTRATDASALTSLGGSTAVNPAAQGGLSAEQFAKMSREERAKVPAETRQKLWSELGL